jgi:Flp pilus assembly protein protease CpaA
MTSLLVITIGILTSLTDLKNKKIYNLHLLIGGLAGLAIIIGTNLSGDKNIFLYHAINGAAAFVIGFILHHSAIWRGGDAKLFALYAFLMPPFEQSSGLIAEPTSLFACSFIIGMLILAPVFIKDVIFNHKAIIKDLLLPTTGIGIFTGMGTILFFSWIFFPFYHLNPVIKLTLSYLIFSWGYAPRQNINLKRILLELLCVLIIGFLMRLWLSPASLSYAALMQYLWMIVLFSVIATCIHTIFNHFKSYQERIPFAPLLLIGYFLSYTPFLTWIRYLAPR